MDEGRNKSDKQRKKQITRDKVRKKGRQKEKKNIQEIFVNYGDTSGSHEVW